MHCTPTSPKVRARRACRRSKRWVSFSIHVGGPQRLSLDCQSVRTGQTRCLGRVGAGVEKVVVLPSASVELVELELLELASSSSWSDLPDRVVPLVPFLELSVDGRSDVAALAVPGVGRVGVFLIDE
eukprot:g82656.t1